jgi:hypothetical protein
VLEARIEVSAAVPEVILLADETGRLEDEALLVELVGHSGLHNVGHSAVELRCLSKRH